MASVIQGGVASFAVLGWQRDCKADFSLLTSSVKQDHSFSERQSAIRACIIPSPELLEPMIHQSSTHKSFCNAVSCVDERNFCLPPGLAKRTPGEDCQPLAILRPDSAGRCLQDFAWHMSEWSHHDRLHLQNLQRSWGSARLAVENRGKFNSAEIAHRCSWWLASPNPLVRQWRCALLICKSYLLQMPGWHGYTKWLIHSHPFSSSP